MARRAEVAEAINSSRTNPDYFPASNSPRTCAPPRTRRGRRRRRLHGAVRPLADTARQPRRLGAAAGPGTVLVSLMKGVELGSAMRMSEVIEDVAKVGPEQVAVVTGPNLAREIAARMPAAAVVACTDEAVARRLQAACHTPYFARTPTPTSSL
nr:hypothetical protein [Streptomyces sp. F001]